MNLVLKTTRAVMENSKHVRIDHDKIDEFCKDYDQEKMEHWLKDSPFELSTLEDEDKLNFLFVFNSINFCYWGEPKWTVEYRGAEYDGAWGMIVALGKALDEKTPILDASYLAALSKGDLEYVLRGNVDIPLFEERWQILKEIVNILKGKYNGSFNSAIESADGDAMKLLDIIIANFPSFEDSSIYNGKKVTFSKRAQLLVSDIYNLFNGKGYGELNNIENLTAFADYKIPQSLRKIGILSYTDRLARRVDKMCFIPKDSEEEIEIRANTIWVIELIKRKLNNKIPRVTSIEINDHLWLLGQKKSVDDKPYHRTRTTAY